MIYLSAYLLFLFSIGCKQTIAPDYLWQERAVCIDPEYKQEQECSNNALGGALVGGLLAGSTGAVVGGMAGSSPDCKIKTIEQCKTKDIIKSCWSRKHQTWVKNKYCIEYFKSKASAE